MLELNFSCTVLLMNYYSSLHILDISTLSDLQIFSPVSGVFFHFLCDVFSKAEVFNFGGPVCQVFLLYDCF